MKLKTIRWIATGVSSFGGFLVLMFGLTWMGIEWRGFFGPKRADVERKIFYQTRSYNQGMIQQLARYRLQYKTAKTDEERKVVASTVRMMFSEYDHKTLNPELQNFMKEVMK